MKKVFLPAAIILISLSSFSQNNNEIRLYYGLSDSKLLRNDDLTGFGSYDVENFSEFGIRFLRRINNNLAVETGVNYTTADLKISPHFMGEPVQERTQPFKLISIPIYANYTLWNFFFINAGPLVDLQTSENTTDLQSGIGYSVGVGGKYNFDGFVVFSSPNFKRHAVIPFEKEDYHQNLTEFGIQFGLGYTF